MLSAFTNWRLNRLYSALSKLNLSCRPRCEWVDERGVLRFSVDPVETSDIAYTIVHGGLSKKAVRLILRENEWDLWRLVWEQKTTHLPKISFTAWRLNRLYSALAKLELTPRPTREWKDERGILHFSVEPAEPSDIAYAIVHGGLSEKTRFAMLRRNEWDLWRLVWERKRKRPAKAV